MLLYVGVYLVYLFLMHACTLPTPTSSSMSLNHIINRQESSSLPTYENVAPCLKQLDAAWHINQHLSFAVSQTLALRNSRKVYDCEKYALATGAQWDTDSEVLSASIDANDNRNDSLITTLFLVGRRFFLLSRALWWLMSEESQHFSFYLVVLAKHHDSSNERFSKAPQRASSYVC